MSPTQRTRLTQFLPAAQAAGYETGGFIYRSIRDKATEARFPAEMVNQIWYFNRDDLAAIAGTLGLKAHAPSGHRRAA